MYTTLLSGTSLVLSTPNPLYPLYGEAYTTLTLTLGEGHLSYQQELLGAEVTVLLVPAPTN